MATTVHGSAYSGTNAYFAYTLVTENKSIKITDCRLGIRNSTSSSITLKNISSSVNWGSPDSGSQSSTSSILSSRVVSADSNRKIYPAEDGKYFATRTYYRGTTSKTKQILGEVSDDVKGERGVVATITIPALPKFTINYYMNGTYVSAGSSSNTYSDLIYTKSNFITDATGQTYPCSSVTKPQKTGYTFNNWVVSETGSSNDTGVYYSGSPNTYHAIARWTPNTYTLTYNANGGSVSPSSKSVTYDSPYGTLATPTRTGYTFGGWSISTGTLVNANTICHGNATLTAVWTGNKYPVTLNQNTGSGGTTSVTATYGSAMPNITIPTKNGYAFKGYYDAESGGNQYYTSSGTSARAWNKTSATTLYAQWTELKVILRYNVNGGTVTTGTGTERWRVSGTYLQRSTDSGTTWATVTQNIYTTTTYANMWNVATPPIIKTGYHIVGTSAWNTNASGTGLDLNQDYSASSTTNPVTAYRLNNNAYLTSDKTIDVYPKWIANTYTVVYNDNGATSGSMSNSSHIYGVAQKLNANQFIKTGYHFLGWATSSTGSKVYDNQQSVSNLTTTNAGTVQLYAIWEKDYCSLIYNYNGGTYNNSTSFTTTIRYGETHNIINHIPTYNKNKFLGWGTTQNGVVVYRTSGTAAADYQTSYPTTTITNGQSITLYAIWTPSYTAPTFNNLSANRGYIDVNSGEPQIDDQSESVIIQFEWTPGRFIGDSYESNCDVPVVPLKDNSTEKGCYVSFKYHNDNTSIYKDTQLTLTNTQTVAYEINTNTSSSTSTIENENYYYPFVDSNYYDVVVNFSNFTTVGLGTGNEKSWPDTVNLTSFISPIFYVIDVGKDGNTVAIGGTAKDYNEYELLTSLPNDWDTNWTNYYQINNGVYEQISSQMAPAFQLNTYYKYSPTRELRIYIPTIFQVNADIYLMLNSSENLYTAIDALNWLNDVIE